MTTTLCNNDCDSIDGNRHKATAQRMPSGRKQDWGDRPLFDQSDLYVIPEALIYVIMKCLMGCILPRLAPVSRRMVW